MIGKRIVEVFREAWREVRERREARDAELAVSVEKQLLSEAAAAEAAIAADPAMRNQNLRAMVDQLAPMVVAPTSVPSEAERQRAERGVAALKGSHDAVMRMLLQDDAAARMVLRAYLKNMRERRKRPETEVAEFESTVLAIAKERGHEIPTPGIGEGEAAAQMAFNCLTLKQRKVFLLHQSGCKHDEIARVLEIDMESVRRTLIAAYSELNVRVNGSVPLTEPVTIEREEVDIALLVKRMKRRLAATAPLESQRSAHPVDRRAARAPQL